MIELRNLTKYYPVNNGIRYVLRDVSLIIPSRTNLAVLGPNGSGKSTFLRLIGGAEPADSGTIITDEEISWPLGLSSGFQGSLTGRQNIMFVCRINGLDSNQTSHVIDQVINFTEIGEYFDMPISTYSSGMRARLCFGLSMAFEFDVYLIDELTSVGDTIFKEKAKAAFEKIRKRASLIFVSHSVQTLKQSCQSALFLRDGMADYYPDIDEGLEVYTEYIQNHRNHSNPKQGAKHIPKKILTQLNLPMITTDDHLPENPGNPTPPPKPKWRRLAAKKAARRKARLENNKSEIPSDGAPLTPPIARKMAAKKAARRKARLEKAMSEGASDGASPASPKARKMAARKAARQRARRALAKTVTPPNDNQPAN